MSSRLLSASVFLTLATLGQPQATPAEIVAAELKLDPILRYKGLQAFTWDERGRAWVLSTRGNQLTVSSWGASSSEAIRPLRSFPRVGNAPPGLLVGRNTAFISDGEVIRTFAADSGKPEGVPRVPPPRLFPPHLQVTSLAWAPLGAIYFLYESSYPPERGIGRVSVEGNEWDVVAKGTFTNLAFDPNGFLISADAGAKSLFRVAWGLDYDRGLETYAKSDLALKTDLPELAPSFAMIFSGSGWTEADQATWIVYDAAHSTLEQFKEESDGLKRMRTLVHFSPSESVRDLQVGPDGAAWLLVTPVNDTTADRIGTFFRLAGGGSGNALEPGEDLTLLSSSDLVARLESKNLWRRETALRILDQRDELRFARGLHPGTPVRDAFYQKTNSPTARFTSLLSQHRLGLLDEVTLETAADDADPVVRAWAALLFGERNYPTGVAFQKILKIANDTNLVARSAAAIAARQFNSGSLAVDIPPRAMPIREVFTGGILSRLWFSTETGSTPEFDLLFWNAVRPITAYDAAHPMGFFNGERESTLALAYWMVGLITRQIAESEDPLKQQDAMLMVAELNPANSRMLIAALRGLENGSANRRVIPTDRSLQVLSTFAKSTNSEIASLAERIRQQWQQPFQ